MVDGRRKAGTIVWGDGGRTSVAIGIAVDLAVSTPYVEFNYSYFDQPIKYRMTFVTVPSNLGRGNIWYFVCPQTFKRCRVLYGVDGYFGHREASPGRCTSLKLGRKVARNSKASRLCL